LFAVHNTSKILTNSVSARHRAKCPIFGLFAKFGDPLRRNENRHRTDFFSAKSYQDCTFELIFKHNCLLLTTRRNIDELCIFTSPVKMFYFRTFRKIRRSTSKRKGISAKLFQRWKLSKQFFRTNYLPQLSAVYNSSKYKRNLYRHAAERSGRFSDFSASSAVDVVERKTSIGQIV